MSETTVTPSRHVVALRRLKRDRNEPVLLYAMSRWFERWLKRQTDVVYSAPEMTLQYDPMTMRQVARWTWDEAPAPTGYGRIAVKGRMPVSLPTMIAHEVTL